MKKFLLAILAIAVILASFAGAYLGVRAAQDEMYCDGCGESLIERRP